MPSENSKIDDNRRHTLMGVTDDVNAFLKRLLVDPTTNALKCTAVLSNVTVSSGGTGLTSLTPYAVITGGTTATGAMQQVSGLGSSTQVLTSNGAGALPTWQDLPASTGASKALDNLASVAINLALIPGTAGALDFGSTTKPWASLWLAGTSGTPATNQFKITGASTGGVRTITLPDASITVNAAADISGTTLASNVVTSSLTAVGTIVTGVWNGTTIKANYLQQAAADLGAADINLNFGNTNGAFNTNLTIDGTFQAGSIGVTGTRIATGFFTDLTVTNAIAGSVTGNAATVTTNANLTGPITSSGNATALADKITKKAFDEVGKTYTPSSGSQTVALDCAANNMHIVTGNDSGTAITFTIANATNSQPFIVSILQGATTLSTIAGWFSTIRWAGGSAPTLTATLNKRDTFGFIRTGTNTYDGFVIGQNC